jgi:prepilin-type N-terminal cleavage/methylation domain-containing protein
MKRFEKGFSLVEIIIAVAIFALVIVVSLPLYSHAVAERRQNTCQENLSHIDGAKLQWALDRDLNFDEATPAWDDVVGSTAFLREKPFCPSGGEYVMNVVSEPPACTVSTRASFPHFFPQPLARQGEDITPAE